MAHNQHNRSKSSGGLFLILMGALIFITTPVYLQDSPELAAVAIAFGFAVGGIGFYVKFVRNRTRSG